MDMQGSRDLATTQQQAWDALNDPDVLKVCIPGCESIEATGEHAYAVSSHIKVGPVAARFKSTIELTDMVAPESYTLNFSGNGGAAGFGKGTARVTLTPLDSGCTLAYQVNVTVGGKIAQVGQRLIDGVARSMAENFFKRFDEELERRHPAPADADPSAPADGASARSAAQPAGSTRSAGRVRTWVWAAVAVVVALGILWASR